MPHKGWLGLGVVLFVFTLATAIPQVLDSVPYLPQYEYKPKPVETLSELLQGQGKFVNYKVAKSSEIASGSLVHGNVTFWFPPLSYQIPYVRILTEADYKRVSPAEIDSVNVATFTDLGRGSWNETYSAYNVAYNFTCYEATGTSYYFLFDLGLSGAKRVTIDILTEERAPALWKTIVPWASMSLTIVSAVLSFYKGKGEYEV